eukprot:5363324-Prymnesium_polylepis.1
MRSTLGTLGTHCCEGHPLHPRDTPRHACMLPKHACMLPPPHHHHHHRRQLLCVAGADGPTARTEPVQAS